MYSTLENVRISSAKMKNGGSYVFFPHVSPLLLLGSRSFGALRWFYCSSLP